MKHLIRKIRGSKMYIKPIQVPADAPGDGELLNDSEASNSEIMFAMLWDPALLNFKKSTPPWYDLVKQQIAGADQSSTEISHTITF